MCSAARKQTLLRPARSTLNLARAKTIDPSPPQAGARGGRDLPNGEERFSEIKALVRSQGGAGFSSGKGLTPLHVLSSYDLFHEELSA